MEKIADKKPVRPCCVPCVGGAEEASVEWLNPISKQESSSRDRKAGPHHEGSHGP